MLTENIDNTLDQVCNTVMSLDHIDDIMKESKGKENLIVDQLKNISQIGQNHNLGDVVGSTVLHKHFDLKPNQIVVWEMCKPGSKIYHPVFEKEVEKSMFSRIYELADETYTIKGS